MSRGFSKPRPLRDEHIEHVPDDELRPTSSVSPAASPMDRSDSNSADEAEREDNSAPLRVSLKQYSTLVWWMLAMSTAILYSGYDGVVLSQINSMDAYQRDMGDFMDDAEQGENTWVIPAIWLSMWDGIGPLGQIAGTAVGGWLIDRMGRKFSLQTGSAIGASAIAILTLCNTPKDKDTKRIMILVGKILQGFGLGIIKMETFTYMSEVVPVSLKGAVMSLVPMFGLLGQFTGAIIVFVLNRYDASWSYMVALGSQWAFALPPFVLAFFLPESPVYLLQKKKDTQGALTSFARLLGPKNDAAAALQKMRTTLEEEEKMAAKASYADCFNASNRRRTFIIIMASLAELYFGLSLLSSVSYWLQQMGMKSSNSLLFMIAGVLCGILSNVGSAWTLSHISRRKLYITSLLITSGLWAAVGFAGIKEYSFTAWLVGGLCTGIIVTVGLGAWPTSYAIIGETSSLRLRSKSQAIAGLTRNISDIAMNFLLPLLYNPDSADLRAKLGFLFAGTSALGAVLAYFFLPELKGRSALEIDHLFEKGVRSVGSTGWRDAEEPVELRGV